MSPSVGENSWRDLRADMPLLTRALRTLCAFGLLREGLVSPFPLASTQPSPTVGLLPRSCFRALFMPALVPARVKVSVVQRTLDRCPRRFPSHADYFSPAREFPGNVRAPVAIPTAPLNRLPDRRTSESE